MYFQQKQPGQRIVGSKAIYNILNYIGQGSGGIIYKGQIQNTKQYVAIKIQKFMMQDEQYISQMMSQKIFKNVVNIIEFIHNQGENEFVIIMDLCDGGDLRSYLQKHILNQNTVKLFITQIIEGTQELHNLNLIHRDLKPDNILVFYNQNTNNVTLKLCDLGLVKNQDAAKTINIGTPYYMAPEIIKFDRPDSPTDTSIDIWALGCIWYEMLSQKFLFDGKSVNEVYEKIVKSDQAWIDYQINQLICNNQRVDERDKKILKRMICIDKIQRLTAQQLIQTLNGTNKFLEQSNPNYEQQLKELERQKMAEIKKIEDDLRKKQKVQLDDLLKQQEEQLNRKQRDLEQQMQKARDEERQRLIQQGMNEQLIQNILQELEDQKNEEFDKKILNERERQKQELEQYKRQQNEESKENLKQLELKLRKEIEQSLKNQNEQQIEEMKRQNDQELKQLKLIFENQLRELQAKQESVREESDQQGKIKLEQIEAEKRELEKQYEQEKINKQKEQTTLEKELRQIFQKQMEAKEQQLEQDKFQWQIDYMINQLKVKKEKYENDLQNFQLEYQTILPKLQQQLNTETLQVNFQIEPNQQSDIQINQLEQQIQYIDSQQYKLNDNILACQQRRQYIELEDILNEQNSHYYILNNKIQQLKQSLDILRQEQLDQLNQLVNQYKEEEISQKQQKQQFNTQQSQNLKAKQIKYQKKVNLYVEQIKFINGNLKNQFQSVLGISSLQYQQLGSSENFLQKLKKIFQFYQSELKEYENSEEGMNFESNGYNQEQLDQLEQQLEIIKSKKVQIQKDQVTLQELYEEQNNIKQEYDQNLTEQQSKIQELKKQIMKLYEEKNQSYVKYKDEFKQNKYATDSVIDKDFSELTEKLNKEQEQLLQEICKLQQLNGYQKLSEQIVLYNKQIKIIQKLQEKEQELKTYNAVNYFKQFKESLIYKPNNQKNYSINKVKLRTKIKDQALIRQILRLQDDEINNKEEIIKLHVEKYDQLIKQIDKI